MLIKDYLPYLANPAAFSSSTGPVYMTDRYISPRFHGPELDRLAADVFCPLSFGRAYVTRPSNACAHDFFHPCAIAPTVSTCRYLSRSADLLVARFGGMGH